MWYTYRRGSGVFLRTGRTAVGVGKLQVLVRLLLELATSPTLALSPIHTGWTQLATRQGLFAAAISGAGANPNLSRSPSPRHNPHPNPDPTLTLALTLTRRLRPGSTAQPHGAAPTGSNTYGCSLGHLRLQPRSPTVAGARPGDMRRGGHQRLPLWLVSRRLVG